MLIMGAYFLCCGAMIKSIMLAEDIDRNIYYEADDVILFSKGMILIGLLLSPLNI
jgi:hypothetical protein